MSTLRHSLLLVPKTAHTACDTVTAADTAVRPIDATDSFAAGELALAPFVKDTITATATAVRPIQLADSISADDQYAHPPIAGPNPPDGDAVLATDVGTPIVNGVETATATEAATVTVTLSVADSASVHENQHTPNDATDAFTAAEAALAPYAEDAFTAADAGTPDFMALDSGTLSEAIGDRDIVVTQAITATENQNFILTAKSAEDMVLAIDDGVFGPVASDSFVLSETEALPGRVARDSGAIAEAGDLTADITGAEAGSLTVEEGTIAAEVSGSDTTLVLIEATTQLVEQTATDTVYTSEAQGDAGFGLADDVVASEAGEPTADLDAADAGSLLDEGSLVVTLPTATETGTAVEIASYELELAATDAATATDAFGDRVLTADDLVSLLTETSSPPDVDLTTTDTATVFDDVASVEATLATTDAATEATSLDRLNEFEWTDSFALAETLAARDLEAADYGTTSEAGVSEIFATDSIAASELALAPFAADSITATETDVWAGPYLAEEIVAADVATLTLVVTDAATLAETPINADPVDSIAFTETLALFPGTGPGGGVYDEAAFADAGEVVATLENSDASATIEEGFVDVEHTASDAITLSDPAGGIGLDIAWEVSDAATMTAETGEPTAAPLTYPDEAFYASEAVEIVVTLTGEDSAEAVGTVTFLPLGTYLSSPNQGEPGEPRRIRRTSLDMRFVIPG